MKTNEVAKLTGITVRTLQYYDKIGLLQPKKNQWNQYREYAKEVKERWGDTSSYAEYTKKSKNYGKEQWAQINGKANEILKEFSELRHLSPDCPEVQAQVKLWQDHITKSYYTCTDEILYGLSLMYVNDERFQKNIDKNGEGTAAFLAKAIGVYCKKA